ncbi:hypothetical protein [Acidisoma cladoniae]|uniref:hypothetical protein n=1 Tax=Acidisoma cladoniae TaxID=3040935 RepID=UPI00254B048D|nr:hypothetical protein [Acidisoma sp. PAMC 29798]
MHAPSRLPTPYSRHTYVPDFAAKLDRLADQELAWGHIAVAERLSQQAAQMRETSQ